MTTAIETAWPRLGLRTVVLMGLLGALVVAFLLSLALGSVAIPLDNVVRILLGGTPDKATWADILWKFRLPKALTALFAGAALAVSGLQMQTLFRNPLADPYILGVSSGASLPKWSAAWGYMAIWGWSLRLV
jgi:iron complex transport system permease protein